MDQHSKLLTTKQMKQLTNYSRILGKKKIDRQTTPRYIQKRENNKFCSRSPFTIHCC